MNQREKILAALVALMIVGWGGTQLWKRYQDALSNRRNRVTAAREALETTKLAEARGQAAMKNLDRWQERSLPGNAQQARALYRTWLLERMGDSGLTDGVLKYTPQQRRSSTYETIGYTIDAKGTTAAVTKFLYDFYHSDHMHKIAYLRLRPEAGSENLVVTMRVEGLIVAGAVRDDALSEGESDRLALDDGDAYRESLTGRNVFKTYSPGGGEQLSEEPQPTDHSSETYLTSIQGGPRPLVWFTNRANGRVLRLHKGGRIRIAGFFGRVEEIRQYEVVVSKDGDEQRRLVRLNKSLGEGTPVKLPNEPDGADEESNTQTGG